MGDHRDTHACIGRVVMHRSITDTKSSERSEFSTLAAFESPYFPYI